MKQIFTASLLAAMTWAAPASAAEVHTYASQVKDVDSVNSHWFQTSTGVVLIDVQRLLPEAERMIEHLRSTTTKPVVLVVITHAHTDHYGGLPVVMAAFPDARVVTDQTTLQSLRTDGRGYIEARGQRHGERFASQDALTKAASAAEVIKDGDEIQVGADKLKFTVVGESEAEATTIFDVLNNDAAFIGDLINVNAPAVPFENIDNWLKQLDLIEAKFGSNEKLYQGHGPAPTRVSEVVDQRRFLRALKSSVAEAAADGFLSKDAVTSIVFNLEGKWPFYQGVAGNTRQQVLAFAVRTVAKQMGKDVEASN